MPRKKKKKKRSSSDCHVPVQVPATTLTCDNTAVQEETKRSLGGGILGLRVSAAKKVVKSTYCSSLGPACGNLLDRNLA